MEVKEISREKNVVVREYTFDKEDIKRLEDKATQNLNKRKVLIEGFRPGRVPKEIYKMRLKESFYEIYVASEAIEEVERMLDNEEVELIIPVVISDAKFSSDAGTVTVELHFEPEVSVDLSKIKLRKAKEDETIDGYVEFKKKILLEQNVTLEPKEGPAEVGDQVVVKERVLREDKEVRNEEEKNYIIFEDDKRDVIVNLIGKKAGDVVEFEKTFKTADGRDLVYKYILEITQIYKRLVPEFTDEFVKGLGIENVETVEQFERHAREEGKKIYDEELMDSFVEQFLQQLPEATEMDISEKTLQRFAEDTIEKLKEDGKYEEYLKQFESYEKMVEHINETFLETAKRNLALKKLAKEYDVKIGLEDLRAYAERMAPKWGVSPDKIEATYRTNKNFRDDVTVQILTEKILKTILDKITIEEVSFKKENDNGGEGEK
ncbi:trigger factor [Fervidobacterium thailandense]|uniref:Trigger factor n=1 Tax=Fervidobacterium thailandense TaxID=1008305 RepID=A0A1E3G2F0_9BACT|nr:trigger factor [Fervidobacterium thailandense]ODN30342.1 trigger factor [Fervidobacterium thailandense]